MTDAAARFDAIHARSPPDPDGFLGEAAADLAWTRPYDRVLDAGRPTVSIAGFRAVASTSASTRSTGMSWPGAASRWPDP